VTPLLHALALGAASGARSSAGLAAVALTSTPTDHGALASRLGGRVGTVATALMSVGELVVDKLPTTPSRLAVKGLVPRLVLGATAAATQANRDRRPVVFPALVGAAGAAGFSYLGTRFRAAAQERFGSDRPGAIAEDVAAGVLGYLGARRSS
jgi:uncharacterized membrane protein